MVNQNDRVAILIVNFRNPRDLPLCIGALSEATPHPSFDILICENGGKAAFQELKAALQQHGLCSNGNSSASALGREITTSERLVEVAHLTLRSRGSSVWLARASYNLGYAGAVNALVDRLSLVPDWGAIWILNPDAVPRPNALAELMAHSITYQKGMVGSTILMNDLEGVIASRAGLHLSKRTRRGISIGRRDRLSKLVDIEKVEAALDCVSGASMYVSRACVEMIGPMDEKFFLYYEDVDWGIRAKPCGLGYAIGSVVVHKAGSTIGSASPRRSDRSWLSIYLESRNRILFVRKHFPGWLLYTLALSPVEFARYLVVGSWRDYKTAIQGCLAGLLGEVGAPPSLSITHLTKPMPKLTRPFKAHIKVAISVWYYILLAGYDACCRILCVPPKRKLTILYYHGIRSDFRFEFRRQLDVLSRRMCVLEAAHEGPLSSTKRCVAITFDDAFASVVQNVLPEISAQSFPCTIFVPTGYLGQIPTWDTEELHSTFQERVMSGAQLTSLPEFVRIGSHSVRHVFLSKVAGNVLRDEVKSSRRLLEELTGKAVDLISVPYGDFNDKVIEACKMAGYKFVFTTVPQNTNTLMNKIMRGRVKVEPTEFTIGILFED